jgi:hypothetical protein
MHETEAFIVLSIKDEMDVSVHQAESEYDNIKFSPDRVYAVHSSEKVSLIEKD